MMSYWMKFGLIGVLTLSAGAQRASAGPKSAFLNEVTSPAHSPVLKTIMTSKSYRNLEARVEALYLAALSRRPGQDELAEAVSFIKRRQDTGEAMQDVFWALLNSTEFSLIH